MIVHVVLVEERHLFLYGTKDAGVTSMQTDNELALVVELLQEYPENTPVAACYHLTWPDQKIYRGQLKDLAKIVHDNHLTLTTMLVVGEAIDNRQGLSELYSKHFTHLFRQGDDDTAS